MCWVSWSSSSSPRLRGINDYSLWQSDQLWRGGLPPLGREAALKHASTELTDALCSRVLRLLRSRTGASPLATGFVLTS
ncbi:hypothetical protein EMIT0P43_80176 [Pseudomonas jessenii]